MKKIILASSSPRRKALLHQIGLSFETIKPEVEEKLNPRLKPRGNAEQLSLKKALAVRDILNSQSVNSKKRLGIRGNGGDGFIIIAADTFVVLDGEIIGKPGDKKEAKKILLKLSGRGHIVVTGFTILDTTSKKSITKSIVTKVYFNKLSLSEIDSYIKTGEPMGKAGSYGMQGIGAVFIEKIEGDPFNVIGLPLQIVCEELKKFGVRFL